MYRMYLDEVGVDAIKQLTKDRFRYLSLTGAIIKVDHSRDYLVPAMNRIKAEVFDVDPDEPVCFHRTDIRNASGPFKALKDPEIRERFDELILQILGDCQYTVITVTIDKLQAETKLQWKQTHPYHFLMEVIMEKYTIFLKRMGMIGDIMPEARSKPQDKALKTEFVKYRENGTRFMSADEIQQAVPSQNLKFRTKKDNIAGLQLCDLIAHPSHFCIRAHMKHDVVLGPFAQRVAKILVGQKYFRSPHGKVMGYGAKYLP